MFLPGGTNAWPLLVAWDCCVSRASQLTFVCLLMALGRCKERRTCGIRPPLFPKEATPLYRGSICESVADQCPVRKGFGGMPDSVHSPASDGTTRRSSSRRAATVVGRMYLEGILTEAEAAAGFLYAENVVRTRLKQGRRRGLRFLDGHLQVTSLLVAANPRNI